MLERTRALLANGLEVLAARLTAEPRFASADRVALNPRTIAGVRITPDNALTIPAVWACIRYLSQTTAVLPWHVMLKIKGGAEIQDTHPVDWLLYKRPNKEMSSFEFREKLIAWASLWGNGYAEIEVDSVGRPIALWPIHPERVIAFRDTITNELFYEVDNGGVRPKSILPPERMFHIKGFGDGPIGISVVEYAGEVLGWTKAAQLFGAAFFGNGMTLSGIVANKKALKADGLKRQKAEMAQLHKGPYKSWGVAHLDNDAEFKQMGVTPEQGQFITTNQHLVEEVCRLFGVPPHKVMHLLRATFSNIEHQAIEVVVDSISPWVKRLEDEADAKLFGQNRSNYYTKINMRALMRGDMVSRMNYYKGMVSIGSYSPNKVLEYEDENTLGEEGDLHVMQAQWRTLEQIKNPPEGVQPAPGVPVGGSIGPRVVVDDGKLKSLRGDVQQLLVSQRKQLTRV